MTPAEAAQWTELGLKVGGWILGLILRHVDGDDSPEVRRAMDILPPDLRADVEHARQRRLTREAIEEDLGIGGEELAVDLAEKLNRLGMDRDLAKGWALAVHGLGPVPVLEPIGERETEPPPNPFEASVAGLVECGNCGEGYDPAAHASCPGCT